MASKPTNLFDIGKDFKNKGKFRTIVHRPNVDDDFWETKDSRLSSSRPRKTEYVDKYRKKQEDEFLRHFRAEGTTFDGSHLRDNRTIISEGGSVLERDTRYSGSVIEGGEASSMKKSVEILAKTRFRPPQESTGQASLPILGQSKEIMKTINNNTICVITGPTGCGKTTMVPQFILQHHKETREECRIVVTQPRRIAAQSVARRVANNLDVRLGTTVGYKVGLDRENFSPDTLLLYCTTGVLKKMLIGHRRLTDWTHIIIDEVHDREEDMDFVLLLCKKFIFTNSRLVKLILMSATLSIDKLTDYFKFKARSARGTIDILPGVFKLNECSPFKIHEYFVDHLEANELDIDDRPKAEDLIFNSEKPELKNAMVKVCFNLIRRFSDRERMAGSITPGAVLVFLPGEAEISTVKNYLESNGSVRMWTIFPLHSRIPSEDVNQVFLPLKSRRKIILATNIAESSITIPDIVYVIDFCLTKNLMCDASTNYVSLNLQWADRNSCQQRRGRCGRVQDGFLYRLVTEKFFQYHMPKAHPPEILRAPLDKVILDTKLLDMGSPMEILALAIDPPDLDNISSTVMQLKEIGALLTTVNGKFDEDDGDLTVLGEIVAALPIDVHLGKLVLIGFLLDVLEETVIIAAGLSCKSIFSSPFDKKLEAYAHKLFWANQSFSDCFAVLTAYTVWKSKKDTRFFKKSGSVDLEFVWCQKRYLQLKSLQDMEKVVSEIYRGLKKLKIENPELPNRQRVVDEASRIRSIQIAIFGAFYPNYLIRNRHSRGAMKEVYRILNAQSYSNTVYLTKFPLEQAEFAGLYTNQIKEMFARTCLINRENVDVEVSSSRVFVTFKPRRSKFNVSDNSDVDLMSIDLTGEILHQVYVALKIRSLPKGLSSKILELTVYTDGVASDIYNELKEKSSSQGKRTSRAHFKSVGSVSLPSVNDKALRAYVVNVENPNRIFVNLAVNYDALGELEEAIENVVGEKIRDNSSQQTQRRRIDPDLIYLAHFNDGNYYRARISLKDQDYVRVRYIDYGNSADVKYNELISLDDTDIDKYPVLVSLPGQALQLSLANIKPNQIRATGFNSDWDEEAVEALTSLFPEGGTTDRVVARIVSIVPTLTGHSINVEMSLFKPPNTDINETFLSMKDSNGLPFAQKENSESIDLGPVSLGDQLRRRLVFDHEVDLGHDTKSVLLQGPHHPLEARLSCLQHVGASIQVSIEPDSVNSVYLDTFPNSNIDQWIVCGRLDVKPNHSALLARQTTVMPNYPGLGALLMMVFAPRVELRVDRHLNKYTGCIAGLGSRSLKHSNGEQVPYYTNHDMEIRFDVNVDQEDINVINSIRLLISNLLWRPTGQRDRDGILRPLEDRILNPPLYTVREKIIECQSELRASMDDLIFRHRRVKESTHFKHEYKWNQLPTDVRRYEVPIKNQSDYIYPAITSVDFSVKKGRDGSNIIF